MRGRTHIEALKEELAWATYRLVLHSQIAFPSFAFGWANIKEKAVWLHETTYKRLRVISNIMLFKTVIPLRN